MIVRILTTVDVFHTTNPSPDPSMGDTVTEVTETAKKWWDFLLGVPLNILLIIAISVVVLMVFRKLINKVTAKLAQDPSNTKMPTTERGKALRAVNPLANARRAQRSNTIGSVLRSVASLAVGTIAVLLILDELNINIAPILASASVVGVALGFGAQSLVKDFLSGIFLIIEDQYGVGDNVEIGEVQGTVEAIALRITKVRDEFGTLWYLRNGDVLKVGNKTHGWAVAAIEINVPYDSDVEAVRSALATAGKTLKSDRKIASALRSDIRISSFESMSASAISLKVQVKTLPARQWDVSRALREQIRTEFEQQGLTLAE